RAVDAQGRNQIWRRLWSGERSHGLTTPIGAVRTVAGRHRPGPHRSGHYFSWWRSICAGQRLSAAVSTEGPPVTVGVLKAELTRAVTALLGQGAGDLGAQRDGLSVHLVRVIGDHVEIRPVGGLVVIGDAGDHDPAALGPEEFRVHDLTVGLCTARCWHDDPLLETESGEEAA